MPNNQLLGFVAALLLVLVVLLAVNVNQRHQRTVGDKISDAVEELKED
jgi:hypothetical protein